MMVVIVLASTLSSPSQETMQMEEFIRPPWNESLDDLITGRLIQGQNGGFTISNSAQHTQTFFSEALTLL